MYFPHRFHVTIRWQIRLKQRWFKQFVTSGWWGFQARVQWHRFTMRITLHLITNPACFLSSGLSQLLFTLYSNLSLYLIHLIPLHHFLWKARLGSESNLDIRDIRPLSMRCVFMTLGSNCHAGNISVHSECLPHADLICCESHLQLVIGKQLQP